MGLVTMTMPFEFRTKRQTSPSPPPKKGKEKKDRSIQCVQKHNQVAITMEMQDLYPSLIRPSISISVLRQDSFVTMTLPLFRKVEPSLHLETLLTSHNSPVNANRIILRVPYTSYKFYRHF